MVLLCNSSNLSDIKALFGVDLASRIKELRLLLYGSTGSAVPSPRSVASAAAVMDMAAALNIFPGLPSAASAMSPNPFTPPMSPSGNGMAHYTLASDKSFN